MRQLIISLLATAVLAMSTANPVLAEGHRGGHGWGGGERDIRHFENHHLSIWRGGNWYHGRHEGRLGWWWIAAGMWYFYPQPVYPYPDPYIPPVVLVQPAPALTMQPAVPVSPPPAQSWYYCETSKSYYPYVPSCPAGWKTVPASPPDTPPRSY
jgi:hypothetical protein